MTIHPPNTFSRKRSDDVPLERTPPIESWWRSILAGLGFLAFVVSAYFLLGQFGDLVLWLQGVR